MPLLREDTAHVLLYSFEAGGSRQPSLRQAVKNSRRNLEMEAWGGGTPQADDSEFAVCRGICSLLMQNLNVAIHKKKKKLAPVETISVYCLYVNV